MRVVTQHDRELERQGLRPPGHHIHRLLFLLLTTTTSSVQPAKDQETEETGAADGIRSRTALPPGARKSDYAPGKGGQGLFRARRNSCTYCKSRSRTIGPELAERDLEGRSRKRRQETVVVVDDEDNEEEERGKSKIPAPRDQALAAAFTYNSTNPNVVASAPARRRLLRVGLRRRHAPRRQVTARVEVVIPLPTKRARTHAGETPSAHTDQPTKKRRYVVDEQDQDDDDDSEIVIFVDAPRGLRHAPKVIHTSISINTSTLESTLPLEEQALPITPKTSTLSGLQSCQNPHARRSLSHHAHSATSTRSPILQILCANCKRQNRLHAVEPTNWRARLVSKLSRTEVVPPPAKDGRVDRPVASVLTDVCVCTGTRTTENVPGAPVDPPFGAAIRRSEVRVQALAWTRESAAHVNARARAMVDTVTLGYHKTEHGPVWIVMDARGVQQWRCAVRGEVARRPKNPGLGKGKDRAVVADGVVESPGSVAAAAGSRMRRKSRRKELADEVEVRHNADNDDESFNGDGPRTPPRNICACFYKCLSYPQLTFGRTVEDFECPACRNYCNCSLCSRSAERRTSPNVMVFDTSWSVTAAFTVSGRPLGSTFLHGNKARIIPVSQPTTSPAPAATTPAAPATISTSPIPEPSQKLQWPGICLSGNCAEEIDEGEVEIDGHRGPGTPE
ncbi:hypothetical protein H4582DRAFT_2130263 [Lactarius indigo]|nr:hypothetical protein H4582DRAFT_2130263 [Lactarius indigo]